MSAFRTIFFRPRLALEWRIPIAAVVRTPQGVEGVAAEVLPDPRCLGHLEAWRVASYVRRSLKPRKLAETQRIPDGVPAVTHYVEGRDTVLLMEPLAMDRASLRESVGTIFQRFSTYLHGWSTEVAEARACKPIAYVLPGASHVHSLADIVAELAPVATVVNTGDDRARREFILRVRSVAETGESLTSSALD